MLQRRSVCLLSALFLAFAVTGAAPRAVTPARTPGPALDTLPWRFEANQGQSDPSVTLLTRGRGYVAFFTPTEVVLALQRPGGPDVAPAGDVLRLRPIGGSAHPVVRGVDPLPGRVNYLIGNDPARWHANISTFARVRYEDVYPGIDIEYYGQGHRLEHDFIIAPSADPRLIAFEIHGAERLLVERDGNLTASLNGGTLTLERPVIYQMHAGIRTEIGGAFEMRGAHRVGFAVGPYDSTAPLVIDPVLDYSSYLGGTNVDAAYSVAVDASGNIYAAGQTVAADFPATASPLASCGGFRCVDAFVSKFDPSKTGAASLVYSSYVGGAEAERGRGIAVDADGRAHLVGETDSFDFPAVNAYQPTKGFSTDGFLATLSAAGDAIVYATYLGGGDNDEAMAVAVDAGGVTYVAGRSASSDFPTTADAVQRLNAGLHDSFVVTFDTSRIGGASLVYSTLLGGSNNESAEGLAIDASGNAYITGDTMSADLPIANGFQPVIGGGRDAFLAKIDTSTSGAAGLVYSTYIGGSGSENSAVFHGGVAVDAAGRAYVTGSTDSPDFPTTPGGFQTTAQGFDDAWVVTIDPVKSAAASLVYGTYLGSPANDDGRDIKVDSGGHAVVTGSTESSAFPMTACGMPKHNSRDAFVTRLTADGSDIVFSTFVGGSSYDEANAVALDSTGHAVIAGATSSTDFPVSDGAFQSTKASGPGDDAFVARMAAGGCTDVSIAMTDAPDPVDADAPLTYSITVTNLSSAAVHETHVIDTFGLDFTFVSASPSQGTCDGDIDFTGQFACALGTMPPGAVATIDIVVKTAVTGTVTNTAIVSSAESDTDLTNNTATVETNVRSTSSTDLAIAIAGTPNPVTTNQPLTYTITVANVSLVEAHGVSVTDPLPSNVTFLSATPSQGACTFDSFPPTLQCSLNTLVAGTVAAIEVVVTPPPAAGTLANTATVANSDPADTDPSNNTATVTTTVMSAPTPTRPRIDLAIAMTDAPDPVDVLQPLTYTITATNLSTVAVDAVGVNDLLPASVSYVSAVPTQGSCVPDPDVVPGQVFLRCALGTLAASASADIVVQVAPQTVGVIANAARVVSPQPEGDNSNNVAWVATSVVQSAARGIDLAIAKTDAPDPVVVGQLLTYTLTATNLSAVAVNDVHVRDLLDQSLVTLGSVAPSQGTCVSTPDFVPGQTEISCDLGTLGPGTSASVLIVVTPDTVGTVINAARVGNPIAETDNSNNTAIATTTVREGRDGTIDLAIAKSAAPDPVGLGQPLTYAVTATNQSAGAVDDVTVQDVLSASLLTFVSASLTQGSCVPDFVLVPGYVHLRCSLGTLPAGASATITIVAVPQAAGSVVNMARVESSQPETDYSNNTVTVTTRVNRPQTDLSILKIGFPDPAFVGEALHYQLQVSNVSDLPAHHVHVTDPLPMSATFVSATTFPGGSCSWDDVMHQLDCDWEAIGANSPIFGVDVIVLPTSAGVLTNTATVTSQEPDSQPTNNASTVATTVAKRTDLTISKQAQQEPAVEGGLVRYTVTITNASDVDAHRVVVTDAFDPMLTFVSSQIGCLLGLDPILPSLLCNLGDVPARQSKTIVVTFTPRSAGAVTNQATVVSFERDDNPLDNESHVTIQVMPRPVDDVDLAISKTAAPDPVVVGQQLKYAITVKNLSTVAAHNVTVRDPVPLGATLIAISQSCAVIFVDGHDVVECALGTVAGSLDLLDPQSASVDIWVTPGAAGSITNAATVTSFEPDANLLNNTATVTTAVQLVLTTGPSFVSAQANQRFEATTRGGTDAGYTIPTAVDSDGRSVPVTCSPASGTTFPMGATTVRCTATDISGTASASLTVDVVDTRPPSIWWAGAPDHEWRFDPPSPVPPGVVDATSSVLWDSGFNTSRLAGLIHAGVGRRTREVCSAGDLARGRAGTLWFDGTAESFAEFPGVGQVGRNDFAISLWISVPAFVGTAPQPATILLSNRAGASSDGLELSVQPSGSVRFALAGGGAAVVAEGGAIPFDGTWHFVVAQRDDAESVVFVDGTRVASAVDALTDLIDVSNGNPLVLGGPGGGSHVAIDPLRTFAWALSDDEIQRSFAAGGGDGSCGATEFTLALIGTDPDFGAVPALFAVDAVDPNPVVECKAGGTVVHAGDIVRNGTTMSCAVHDASSNVIQGETFSLIQVPSFGTTLSISDVQPGYSVVEGDNGTTDYHFVVTLGHPKGKTVSVDYSTEDGDTDAGVDYAPSSGTLTFAPGEVQKGITVKVIGDLVPESAELFYVRLTNPVNAQIPDPKTSGAIEDDDTRAITVTNATVPEGNSGITNAVFTVSMDKASTLPVSVDYATTDGTATAVSDYTAASGTLQFAPGETTKTIAIQVLGDLTPEPDETFKVHVSKAVNATLANSDAVGTVLNDDGAIPPPIAIGRGSNVRAEATSAAGAPLIYETPIALDPTGTRLAVSCNPPSGSTFPLGRTTVTCSAVDVLGNAASATFTVDVVDTRPPALLLPGLMPPSHDWKLEIPPPAAPGTVDVTASVAWDSGFSLIPANGLIHAGVRRSTREVCSAGDPAGGRAGVVVLDGSSESYVDFGPNAGQWGTGDFDFVLWVNTASTRARMVLVSNRSAASSNFFEISLLRSGRVVFELNDGAGNFVQVEAGDVPHDGTWHLIVARRHGTTSSLFVDGTLAGSAMGTAPVNIDNRNPLLLGAAPSLEVNDFFEGSLDPTLIEYGLIAALVAVAIDVDLTDLEFTDPFFPAGGGDGTCGRTVGRLTVVATGPSGAAVVFGPDPTPLGLDPTPFAFDVVDPHPIVECKVGGNLVRSGDVFPVGETLVTCTASDAGGNVAQNSFTVVVNPPPVISISDASVVEGDSGTVNATFAVRLSVATNVPVTVEYSTVDGTAAAGPDYIAAGGRLLFTPGETLQNITILVNGDRDFETSHGLPREEFVVALSNAVNAVSVAAQATGIIEDDDPAPNTPAGANVVVTASATTTVTFGAVSTAGFTTSVPIDPATAGTMPGAFVTALFAYEVSTTAAVTGPITLCLTVPVNVNATTFDALRILHSENTVLVDRTILSPDSPVPDFATRTLCARTDSLSPFVIAVRDAAPPTLTVSDITVTAFDPADIVVDFSPTATDDHGDATVVCSPMSGSTFPIGDTTVSCTATDTAGNHTTATFVVSVLDGVPPTIAVPAGASAEATSPGGASVSFDVVASDNVDGVTFSCSPASGSTFPLGTSTVVCTSIDRANNAASASFPVTVQDTTPPTLHLQDATALATSDTAVVVNYVATADDSVDGPVGLACSRDSGSVFPIGTTTVSCTAADSRGNSATGSFHVIVTDGVPPTVTVPADITAEAASKDGAAVTFSATVTDNADASLLVSCTPASGSTFPLGATTVTCRATDAGGNTGSASFAVTVIDTRPPTLTLPAPISVVASAPTGVAVTFTANATDIVDGVRPVTCEPTSGSTFAPGTTTVACSASDTRGNGASGNFTVTVTPVPRSVGTFVAFSRDSTWLRANATVVTGDVGANERRVREHDSDRDADDGDMDDVTVRLGQNVKMKEASSRVVGDTVLLQNKATVYNVIDNFLINRKGNILGTISSPVTLPYLALPAFPVVTPGSTAVTVSKKKTITLAPGQYGVVHVQNGGTLILSGGLYQMLSLDVDPEGMVVFHAASEIRIKTELDTASKAKLILDQSVPGLKASHMVVYVEGADAVCGHRGHDDDGDDNGPTAVHIGAQNVVQANIYAKSGTIWLKSKTQATGAFISGHHVRIGQHVTLTLDSAFK